MDLVRIMLFLSVVTAMAAVARRFGLLGPIVLVVAGVGLSFVPGFPQYELDPELVLAGVLPPLLHVAAVQTSVPDFRRNLRPILLLAVGLVIFTALAVGLVLNALAPDIPLAVCLALGAVVAPPDAVAATAVARRIGLPRRLVSILEGESLLNDATALTLLRVTAAAATGAGFSWPGATGQLLVAGLGGAAVGHVVSRVVGWLHRRTDEPLLDTTLSILTPYLAFVPAEELHTSGVVAVVICGLRLGHVTYALASAQSRLASISFWKFAEFLLQGSVFLLVGLQVRLLVERLEYPLGRLALLSAAVLLTVVVSRFVWIYPATYLARLVPALRRGDPSPPLRMPTVLAWAGMRGVVSLAAALSLPTELAQRDLLVWLTFVVIAGTLVGQGVTLPLLARALNVRADDPTADVLAEAQVQQEAYEVALSRLAELAPGLPQHVVERLHSLIEQRANAVWEQLGRQDRETPAQAYRRARLAMLTAEREVFIGARDAGRIPEDVLIRVQRELDLEETTFVRE